MDEQVSSIIHFLANSHKQLARILEAKRETVAHAALLINNVPNIGMSFHSLTEVSEYSVSVTKSIGSYLIALAELEDAIAENLKTVLKEMADSEDEE